MSEHQHDWQPVYETSRDGSRVVVGYRCDCGAYKNA